jgi:hypothetical protein
MVGRLSTLAAAGAAFLLATACGRNESRPALPKLAFDFSGSYSLWVDEQEGHCRYWLTHVGLGPNQLLESLRTYNAASGVEILTEASTPQRCIAEARQVATKAGFRHVRVRKNTPGDRPPALP